MSRPTFLGGGEWRYLDPDKWLTMSTVSAGGGHGPISLGKLEAGGVNCVAPETYSFLR